MVKRDNAVLAAAGILALLAGGGVAAPQARAQNAAMMSRGDVVTSRDRAFMRQTAEAGNGEIRLGELALRRSSDPSVRFFAQRMVRDHTSANRQLARVARAQGVTLPRTPDPMSQRLYNRLSRLSGPSFDRLYMSSQANAHARLASQFMRTASVTRNQELRNFIYGTLPTVQDHGQMASYITSRINSRYAHRRMR